MPPKMLWDFVTYDLWLLIAVGFGVVARLCDEQVRTLKQSARQLFFSASFGSACTVLFVAWTSFVEAVDIAMCFFFVFFASLLVEVVQKKIKDLSDADLSDWVLDVLKTTISELAKYWPTKTTTLK